MKKLALAIGLVIVLVGSILGGAFYVNAASGPTLQVWWSDPGGIVTVVGSGWVPAVAVNLWMDKQDDAHAVNITIAQSTGNLRTNFNAGPTYLGLHKIIAVQNGGSPVSASFTITSVPQVDDRIYDALGNINTEITNIQSTIASALTIHPVQNELLFVVQQGNLATGVTHMYDVPAHKLLVIEHISASALGLVAQDSLGLSINTVVNGVVCNHFLGLVSPSGRMPVDPDSVPYQYLSQDVRIYADSGTSVGVNAERVTKTNDIQVWMTISGNLIDVP